MRLYQVQVKGVVKKWAGSMAECRAAKPELLASKTASKASEIEYVEAPVPTDKDGLLEFLNKNCVQ